MKISCRLGRHQWDYKISLPDLVVRWCPRCRNPKIVEVVTAKRLAEPEQAGSHGTTDRPLVKLDHDALRAAVAMLAAMERSDVSGFNVLRRHSDPLDLAISLCFLATDALAEPPSTDFGGYVDRLFARLDRSRS